MIGRDPGARQEDQAEQPAARRAQARAAGVFSEAQWSFLEESRRLSNARLKRELRLRLRYPTVRETFAAASPAAGAAVT